MNATLQQVIRLFEGYPNNSNKVANEVAEAIFLSAPSGQIFKAIGNQVGTNRPDFITLKNTVGNLTWARLSNGNYRGEKVGAFLNKKVISSGCTIKSSFDGSVVSFTITRETDDSILIQGYDLSKQSTNLDNLMTNALIEFELIPV